jgi:hypothetical protein
MQFSLDECFVISSELNPRVLILQQRMIFVDLLAKSIGHLGPFDDRFSRIHNPAIWAMSMIGTRISLACQFHLKITEKCAAKWATRVLSFKAFGWAQQMG